MSNKRKRFFRDILPFLGLGTGSFVLAFFLYILPPVQVLEYKISDLLFELRGGIDVSESPVVIVEISEEADNEIPFKYPWPMDIHARLIKNLNRAGAKAIGFDVLFSEQDRYDAKNDTLFAETLKKYGNVFLATDFNVIENNVSRQLPPELQYNYYLQNNPNPSAFVQVQKESGGNVRNYLLRKDYLGKTYYPLGLELVRFYKDLPRDSVSVTREYLKIGEMQLNLRNRNHFGINFHGPRGTFKTIPYSQVIDDSTFQTNFEKGAGFEMNEFDDPDLGLLQEGAFKDKIVLIGATAPALQDYHAAPFAASTAGRGLMPGVEIHANAVQTMLSENFIQSPSGWFNIGMMVFLSLLIVFINKIDSAWLGWTASILLSAALLYLQYVLFAGFNYLIVFTGPFLAIILSQVTTVGYKFFVAQKEKQRIQGMFSSYVSPKLVERMIESGEEPQLGGEEKNITAFFSDIESFSTFSEKLEAGELVTLINEYLNAMTNILTDKGGTLDKYIGDAIVAFFGAPVEIEDHALRACVASQLMQKELHRLREKWKKDGWPDIVVNMKQRMGMNTGGMVTGNMGSERRFNYTMMGDNVNLAARCESGAKQFGVYTMITEATKTEAEKFGDECIFRLLDNIVVKGRTEPVKVYELADLKPEASAELVECVEIFETGLEHYFNQRWDKAIALFEESARLEVHKNNPSVIFMERCKLMKQTPPPEDWDGVYVMTSK